MKKDDPNSILQRNPAELAAMIQEAEALPVTVPLSAEERQRQADKERTRNEQMEREQRAAIEAEAKNKRIERYLTKVAAHRKGAFDRERATNKSIGVIPTGFEKLDEVLGGGLMPKLYGVGAEPGMGKTAFVLQIADQIATSGKVNVIIASLEMSANELIARSLSRMTFIQAKKKLPALEDTERCGEILSGQGNDNAERYGLIKSDEILMGGDLSEEQAQALDQAERTYFDGPAKNLVIREAREDVEHTEANGQRVNERERIGTAKGLQGIIQEHVDVIGENGIDPGKATPKVLIVDYLQRIKPTDQARLDTRTAVEEAIETLKDISREYNMPVIFVSSIGRASYGDGGGLASFKESGAIEYTADVAMIMTLSAHREIEEPAKSNKRATMWYDEQMRQADRAAAKKIDITLPKARSGKKATVQFILTGAYYHLREVGEITDFYPKYSCNGDNLTSTDEEKERGRDGQGGNDPGVATKKNNRIQGY